MDDSNLIRSCLADDSAAQRLLFDRYYKYVYTIAYRYLANHHDAEDVVSETFVRVYKSLSRVDSTSGNGLRRWVQRIAINESLRFIKRKQPIIFTEQTDVLDAVEQGPTLSADGLSHTEIMRAVDSMPRGYRLVFMLSTVDGLSHAEIADHLGISRNTSKSQMLKARKYLQSKLRYHESR